LEEHVFLHSTKLLSVVDEEVFDAPCPLPINLIKSEHKDMWKICAIKRKMGRQKMFFFSINVVMKTNGNDLMSVERLFKNIQLQMHARSTIVY
jgi:hypothetical protein